MARLLGRRRQQLILERLISSGAVRVADLVVEFGVSDATVRRDLAALRQRGLIEKVYGGALLMGREDLLEQSQDSRTPSSPPEVARIRALLAEALGLLASEDSRRIRQANTASNPDPGER